jgi:hypothetical protein
VESKNRNTVIIIVAVAVLLLVACGCGLAIIGAVVTGIGPWTPRVSEPAGPYQERIEESYTMADAPSLEIDNFAGNVSIRAGESGTIHVVATKRASRTRDLSVIGVGIHEKEGGLVIKTGRPLSRGNAAVDLEITTPADSRLDLELGAGNVSVRGLSGGVEASVGAGNVNIHDVTGTLKANTGAGTMAVQGAAGPAHLNNGAGVIMYQGTPQGDCRFNSGAGAISLELPAQPNVTLDLKTGVGTIEIKCPVDGQVSKRRVQGVIGTGDDARIEANAGVGGIGLTCK